MKKYILTTLLGIIGMTAFTSAELITFEGNQNTKVYTPNTITFGEDINITYDNYTDYISNISCNAMVCHISIGNCNIAGSADFMRNISNCNLSAGTYQIGFDSLQYANIFSSITIDNLSSSSGGGTTEEENNGNIIEGGISNFSGIITRLGSIAGEFIPYFIYIAIGILGISLMYQAVKGIINYLSGKSKNAISDRERDLSERDLYIRYRHDKDDMKGKLKNDDYYMKLKYNGKDKGFKKRKKYFGYK